MNTHSPRSGSGVTPSRGQATCASRAAITHYKVASEWLRSGDGWRSVAFFPSAVHARNAAYRAARDYDLECRIGVIDEVYFLSTDQDPNRPKIQRNNTWR